MKKSLRLFAAFAVLVSFVLTAVPCGPSYLQPVFEYKHAPENPYANFAAGRIGVIKPTHRRVVLIAAYRYLNGGGFSEAEQKALVEVWEAEFDNKPYETTNVEESVKKWVAARKTVAPKDEKLPAIYTEREYGGYEFFPNCTAGAFDTARTTLADRISSFGAEDRHVRDWLSAQDKVFANCASGKTDPGEPDDAMPEWLRYDRAYQKAAADFYALDYDSAKQRFEKIAAETGSPWSETAGYLVGRTLIRQASLTKDKVRSQLLYTEAEQVLSRFAGNGRYGDSAERMLGLIKYRIRPQERVRELAQIIASRGSQNFRQDLIDYNWLMDKFSREVLEAKEKKATELARPEGEPTLVATPTPVFENRDPRIEPDGDPDDRRVYLSTDDNQESWSFLIKPDWTDEQALTKAETFIGRPLTERMRKMVLSARLDAYTGRFSNGRSDEYEGGYYGNETIAPDDLPDYLRLDDLTNWLFAFQTEGEAAYNYALAQWKQTDSRVWLLTALTKATPSSPGIDRVFEAAGRLDRNDPAFATSAYHRARLLAASGKAADARNLIDTVVSSTSIDLPISSRNMFLTLRSGLAESLDDYLRSSLKKPFAFSLDGNAGTLDEIIAQQKTYWSAEYNNGQTREEYEQEVEKNFAEERKWADRSMLTYETGAVMNEHFPLSVLQQAETSTVLPDYLRDRFTVAIWTRAALIGDFAVMKRIEPSLLKMHPELAETIAPISAATTPVARDRAILFAILKNRQLTPFVTDDFGNSRNPESFTFTTNWWCAPYFPNPENGDSYEPERPAKPPFLAGALSAEARKEQLKLAALGDAPKFLAERVLAWAKQAPTDKRVPESLYIAFDANQWDKYGCGNNEELRNEIAELLRRRYPRSEWTTKMIADLNENQ